MFILFLLALLAGVTGVCRAQPSFADWNSNGVRDQPDFEAIISCMEGPAVTASPGCNAAFQSGASSTIGIRTVINVFLATARDRPGCVQWPVSNFTPASRGHVGTALGYTPGINGVGATIDTAHDPILCLTPTSVAFSLRWIDLDYPDTGTPASGVWFQSGIATQRNWMSGPTPNVNSKWIFSESIYRQNGAIVQRLGRYTGALPTPNAQVRIDWRSEAAGGNGDVLYQVMENSVFLTWSTPFNPPEGSGEGFALEVAGETLNMQDRMAGAQANPCKFRDCEWSPGGIGVWQSVDLTGGVGLKNPAPMFFGVQFVGTDGMDIWDWW